MALAKGKTSPTLAHTLYVKSTNARVEKRKTKKNAKRSTYADVKSEDDLGPVERVLVIQKNEAGEKPHHANVRNKI